MEHPTKAFTVTDAFLFTPSSLSLVYTPRWARAPRYSTTTVFSSSRRAARRSPSAKGTDARQTKSPRYSEVWRPAGIRLHQLLPEAPTNFYHPLRAAANAGSWPARDAAAASPPRRPQPPPPTAARCSSTCTVPPAAPRGTGQSAPARDPAAPSPRRRCSTRRGSAPSSAASAPWSSLSAAAAA